MVYSVLQVPICTLLSSLLLDPATHFHFAFTVISSLFPPLIPVCFHYFQFVSTINSSLFLLLLVRFHYFQVPSTVSTLFSLLCTYVFTFVVVHEPRLRHVKMPWQIAYEFTTRQPFSAGGNIYVLGGFSGQRLKAVEMYNSATDMWTVLTSMWKVRTYMAAVTVNNKIYVMGGQCLSHAVICQLHGLSQQTRNHLRVILVRNWYCSTSTFSCVFM